MRNTRKGFISIILIMAVLMSALPIVAHGATSGTYGDLNYTAYDNYITITGYNGSPSEIVIPSEIDGMPVTCVDYYIFMQNSNLKKITIPHSITEIKLRSAFGYTYNNLINIEVDENNQHYTSVNGVLYNKDKTELVIYPAGNTQIQYDVPDSVTSIGMYAFCGSKNLTDIVIPNNVTNIGDNAFQNCSNLTNISLNGVSDIGYSAFSGCSSLTSISIPNSVTEIKIDTFSGCSKLSEIVLSDNITNIEGYAFQNCSELTEIKLPDKLQNIGGNAFENCSNLIHINLPNGVTDIGDTAFRGCRNLRDIMIPNSISNIGHGVFIWCDSLADIYYGGSKEEWKLIDIKDWTTKATIHYNATGTKTPKFNTSVNNGKLNFALSDTEYDSKLITVFSNGSIFNNFYILNISAGDTSKQIDIPENSKFAKVFIWDSLTGMKPLCEAQEIPIE